MARAKRGFKRRKRVKKILDMAEGFVHGPKNKFRRAKEAVVRSHTYSYRDRRTKKREFRGLWITRIAAGTNINGLSYSKFIAGLKASEVGLNRKMLADLAARDPSAFSAVVADARSKLSA